MMMLRHIELQFCKWLCFTVLQIKFECRQFASIFVWVMPLLELRMLDIHSFPHFLLHCFDILSWNVAYDLVLLYYRLFNGAFFKNPTRINSKRNCHRGVLNGVLCVICMTSILFQLQIGNMVLCNRFNFPLAFGSQNVKYRLPRRTSHHIAYLKLR